MYQHLEDLFKSVNHYFPNDQCMTLQNQEWVKDPCKEKDKPVDFNVIEYKKVIDMVSESTFKKLLQAEFWWSIREVYLRWSEKAIKIFLCFPTTYLCEARFSSCTSTKTYGHRLKARVDIRIQLFSIKSANKEICKNAKQCYSSNYFFSGK